MVPELTVIIRKGLVFLDRPYKIFLSDPRFRIRYPRCYQSSFGSGITPLMGLPRYLSLLPEVTGGLPEVLQTSVSLSFCSPYSLFDVLAIPNLSSFLVPPSRTGLKDSYHLTSLVKE